MNKINHFILLLGIIITINIFLFSVLKIGRNFEGYEIVSIIWFTSNVFIPILVTFLFFYTQKKVSTFSKQSNLILMAIFFYTLTSIGSLYTRNFVDYSTFINIIKLQPILNVIIQILLIIYILNYIKFAKLHNRKEISKVPLNLKEKIFELIGKGNTAAAVDISITFFETRDQELFKHLLGLKNQLVSARKLYNKNQINHEQYSIINSKTTNEILSLMK